MSTLSPPWGHEACTSIACNHEAPHSLLTVGQRRPSKESGLSILPSGNKATPPLWCQCRAAGGQQRGTPNHSQTRRCQWRPSKDLELSLPCSNSEEHRGLGSQWKQSEETENLPQLAIMMWPLPSLSCQSGVIRNHLKWKV